jgi:oxalate---CoA ligase
LKFHRRVAQIFHTSPNLAPCRPRSGGTLVPLIGCGSIEDVGLGLRWDPTVIAHEVDRRAVVLSQLGIRRGSVVAIAHSGSARFFADLFAVWTVGAAAACLDRTLTGRELQTVVDFTKPAALLVNGSVASADLSVPILELAATRASPVSTISSYSHPDDPALVLFTSGTTGTPKGVVLSFRALKTRIELNAAAIGRDTLKRALVTLPTHFGHGLIGNALTPLLAGGDVVLYPDGATLADDLGPTIDRHGITFMTSVPALWRIAKRFSEPPKGRSLIRVHVGSAPLSAQLWSEIAAWTRAAVVNCYGMTETANWIAGASSQTDGIVDGFVGRPWGGMAAVIDDNGCIQTIGEGEIVIQTPSLMSGYLNRPDLTAAVMTNGWFRTGDRGTVDKLGKIVLSGRIKDEINRAGFKVQPAEIDVLLESHPAIAEACTFAIPDPISGEIVGAAIRFASGANSNLDELRSWCRERLRREATPERWFVVDQIPRSARGKVNRDAVRRILVRPGDLVECDIETIRDSDKSALSNAEGLGSDTKARVLIGSRVRDAVERAWVEVLDRQSFQADHHWNEIGGDSIDALRLWSSIEEELRTQLPLDLFSNDATPSGLIGAIEAKLEPTAHAMVRDASYQRRPLVFFMPHAYGDTPALAQLRAAFKGAFRFEVIKYPQWNEMIDAGSDFNVVVSAAVAQVRAKCGGEACFLVGYSFGGLVAAESARRLCESGQKVGFLGLIDSRLVEPPRPHKSFLARVNGQLRRTWSTPRDAYNDGVWWVSEMLARSPLPLRRQAHRLVALVPKHAAFEFALQLIVRLRTNCLRKHTLGRLEVPVTLFRSDEYSEDAPDHGWSTICKQLVVVPVRGNHQTLLEARYNETLCAQLSHTIQMARGDCPSCL